VVEETQLISARFTQMNARKKSQTANLPSVASRSVCSFLRSWRLASFSFVLLLVIASVACQRNSQPSGLNGSKRNARPTVVNPVYKPLPANADPNLKKFIDAAVAQVGVTTGYDPSYVTLTYPGGDVPKETGVCSDVIVRAFRGVGIDLQKEIHEDMSRRWADYPKRWGLSAPDRNIDHRRVPNLMTYFVHKGKSLPLTESADDYWPGDIVAWDLGGGVDHIGIVTDMSSSPTGRSLIDHNIGAGAKVEDVLFRWRITGHYRYF